MNRKPFFIVMLALAGWLFCSTAVHAQHTSGFSSTESGQKRAPRASASRTPSMSGHGKMSRIGRPAGLGRATGAPGAGGSVTQRDHFTRMPTEPRAARRPTRGTMRPSGGGRNPDGRPAKPRSGFRIDRVDSSGKIEA